MAEHGTTDYRKSHLEKGGVYDAELSANLWDSYMHCWEERHLQRIIPSLFPGKPPRYLDFACGTGRITAAVAPMAAETVGVDVSKSMLTSAIRKLPTGNFIQADLTREPLDLGIFDLVTSFRFFGNAEQDLRAAALRALNPLQEKGGYLVVNNHRNPNSLANRIQRLSGNEITMDLSHRLFQELLEGAGYRIVDVKPIAVWLYRARQMTSTEADSGRARILERLFGARAFAPIAPDAIIVARKV